jgi:hypothetical protein
MNHRFLILVCFLACNSPHNTTPPEKSAEWFASELGLHLQGKPVCTGVDTDNDGYVTCTLALAGGDTPKLMSIQCAANVDSDGCDAKYTTGCKETPIKPMVQTQ